MLREALVCGLDEVAEVGARTECGCRAGDHDGSDRGVGLDAVHGSDDLGDHRGRERVALAGVVQGDRGHAVGDIKKYETHAGKSPTRTAVGVQSEVQRELIQKLHIGLIPQGGWSE